MVFFKCMWIMTLSLNIHYIKLGRGVVLFEVVRGFLIHQKNNLGGEILLSPPTDVVFLWLIVGTCFFFFLCGGVHFVLTNSLYCMWYSTKGVVFSLVSYYPGITQGITRGITWGITMSGPENNSESINYRTNIIYMYYYYLHLHTMWWRNNESNRTWLVLSGPEWTLWHKSGINCCFPKRTLK